MDDTKPIKKGTILKGKLFPETVEVISVDVMEDLTTIYAKGVETGKIYEKVIGEEQLKEIDIVGDYKQIDFSTNPENFFLGIEAKRIRLAFEFDPEILENTNVEDLIQKVIFGEKDVADAEVEIDSIDIEKTKEEIKKLTSEALALKVDVPWGNEIFKLSEENKLVPEYLEQFFIKGFNNIVGDGKIRRRKDGFLGIDWVPYEIKDVPYDFRMKYGIVDDRYPKLTFDKQLLEKGEIADFISPGHPLMEAVIDKILDKYGGLLNDGAIFEDPDGQLHGLIWFLEGTVYDGNGNFMDKKMFSIYSSLNGEINNISPAILWDMKSSSNDKMRSELLDLMKLKQRVLANAITGEFETYRKTLLGERVARL